MPLAAGDRLGPYEIIALIGTGGMGEVYRAHDTRLRRDVAIKVSKEHFSERFEREARAVAALNHPNICTLHDIGPNYLVMELVEGESPKGPLPLEEVVRLATQIAGALEEAHEKGIVHRDLKPANIKIKADGTVKVLDFGLAKVGLTSTPAGLEADPTQSLTISMAVTEAGVILGTAAYMAPEQAQGKPVDKRADIWAFGVVLHELLTGKRIFKGDSLADTLAAVLTQEPDYSAVPARARPLLQRCLVRDPRKRLRDIGEATAWLEAAPPHLAAAVKPIKAGWLWPAAAVVFAAATGVALWAPWRAPAASVEPIRFQIPFGASATQGAAFALSPDGRKLAIAAAGPDGVKRIWIRPLDSLEMHPLIGSEYTQDLMPPFFWSPDSRYIAFDGGGKLKKIDVSGGLAQIICDLPGLAVGGSWNREGVIIFGNDAATVGLSRVSAAGGTAVPLTKRAPGERPHTLPFFLPDGKHFLYQKTPGGIGGIYVRSIDSKPGDEDASGQLSTITGSVSYVASGDSGQGHLLFLRNGTLMAQAFDPQSIELSGEVFPLAEGVGTFIGFGFFSASNNGTVVYRSGNADFQLTWFDRDGKILDAAGVPGPYSTITLSPDGTRVAVSRNDFYINPRTWDLWLLDTVRNASVRATFGITRADYPVWSADGSSIAFASSRDGGGFNSGWNLFTKPASGAKDEDLLLKSTDTKFPSAWSRDGRFLLYTVTDQKTKNDIWMLTLANRKPVQLVASAYNETAGPFSPDGNWFAYTSDESGKNEVYVRRFPDGGDAMLISRGGGSSPRWKGPELFYLALDGQVMAAKISGGAKLQTDPPQALFPTPRGTSVWDVHPDGKRFLLAQPAAQGAEAPFTVVLNWRTGLKK